MDGALPGLVAGDRRSCAAAGAAVGRPDGRVRDGFADRRGLPRGLAQGAGVAPQQLLQGLAEVVN